MPFIPSPLPALLAAQNARRAHERSMQYARKQRENDERIRKENELNKIKNMEKNHE